MVLQAFEVLWKCGVIALYLTLIQQMSLASHGQRICHVFANAIGASIEA